MPTLVPTGTAPVRTLILNRLQKGDIQPIELLRELQSPAVSEAQLKDELAVMIDENIVELSKNRHIKLR